jgi:prepilin-type N-terminal cleavage/methylation domain-containing protein
MNHPETAFPGAKGRRAFTLVEMLVVIGIIGLLAALALGVGPGVFKARDRAKARAELAKLVTVIENYNSKVKSYPPDNPGNTVTNQLFFELMGTTYNPTATTWTTLNSQETINQAALNSYFGGQAFLNTGDLGQAKNFYGDIKSSHYALLRSNPDVAILVGPVRGNPTNELTDVNGKSVNPWRYNSSNPTHNPKKFDLWLEIKVGDEYEIIGNW